jgi:uncharacterized protein YjbI with pentapeptide repeats
VGWLGISEQLPAQESYQSEQTPEGWAWAKVKQGKQADFNARCGTPVLNPSAADEIRWADGCRRISGTFIADLLMQPSLRTSVPFPGIRLVGARIEGEIDLQNARLDRALIIESSLIEGDVNLIAARAESALSFVGSSIGGTFNAWQFYSEISLDLNYATFKRDVVLNSAKIGGFFSLENTAFSGKLDADSLQVGGNLFLRGARHDDEVTLSGAKITGNLYMDGTSFKENVSAGSLVVGASLFIRSTADHKVSFNGLVLRSARITGSIQMDGATFSGPLVADALQVGASMFMRSAPQHQAKFKDVTLNSARITGNVDMDGATFDGGVNAHSMQVGGSLTMRSARYGASVSLIGARVGNNIEMSSAVFKRVDMRGANVTRNVIMEGAVFDDLLNVGALQVGESLFGSSMEKKTTFKSTDLSSARVTGNIILEGATVDGTLSGDGLQVGGLLDMRNMLVNSAIKMHFAQFNRNFDIRGSTLAELDLSGSTIAGDFRLSGPRRPYENTFWRTKENDFGRLLLRNTRITNLSDAKDAWPNSGNLDIGGFRFAHLGGFDEGPVRGIERSGTEREMRDRGMAWWDSWVQRDPSNSPAPYELLATALIATGDREAANEIRFLGRVQQRKTESWPSWVLSGFLQYAAGFGIGDRTFRVLYWVLLISVAGAVYLMKCVPTARKRGAMWCFGASLNRLLPIIELNKEFTDFFNDPKRTRLTGLQVFVFSAVGVVGWVLGAILVAAVSGLTQSP